MLTIRSKIRKFQSARGIAVRKIDRVNSDKINRFKKERDIS